MWSDSEFLSSFLTFFYCCCLCITGFLQFIVLFGFAKISGIALIHVLRLQVVHFYCWKGSALQTKVLNIDSKVVKLSDVQREKISGLNSILLNDVDFASRVFCGMPSNSEENGGICFDWTGIMAAIAAWEDYVSKLSKQIHLQLPYWRMHQSLYNVQLAE